MRNHLGSLWRNNLSLGERLLRLPFRLIPGAAVLPVLTGANRGRWWVVGSNVRRCWLGSYEMTLQRMISSRVRSESVVWDIGANVGFHTLAFSRAVGEHGAVVAFEPQCKNMDYLLRHMKLNNCRNVKAVQCGVSDRVSIAAFSLQSHSSEGKLEACETAYCVPTISLDSYCDAYGARPPDLLKIDVEGAESAVLRGGERLLRTRRPEIWLALHGAQQKSVCGDILRSFGYELVTVTGERIDEIPLYVDTVICTAGQ